MNCEHLNTTTEEIDGAEQKVCIDCGDIINYQVGLQDDQEFDEENKPKGQICDDDYVPNFQNVGISSEGSTRTRLSQNKRKKIRLRLTQLATLINLDIGRTVIDNTVQFCTNFLQAKKHLMTDALIIEALKLYLPADQTMPKIHEFIHLTNSRKGTFKRLRPEIIDYLGSVQYEKIPANIEKRHKMYQYKNIAIESARATVDADKTVAPDTRDSVLSLSSRIIGALDRCNLLYVHSMKVTGQIAAFISCHLHQRGVYNKYFKPSYGGINCRVFADKRRKVEKIFREILSIVAPELDPDMELITMVYMEKILHFIETVPYKELTALLKRTTSAYRKRVEMVQRVRADLEDSAKCSDDYQLEICRSEQDVIIHYMLQGKSDQDIISMDTMEVYREESRKRAQFLTDQEIDEDCNKYLKNGTEKTLYQEFDKEVANK